ncbi:hypothetical protein BGW39_011416 [Mortierella sp. 14UC]|nr:hypothetical protein BGW39_011416 [Mortierella sp. 14UC]
MSGNSNSDYKDFLDTLPITLEKARADGGIPGMSVAIRYKGELVFAQGFGKRNRKDPFTKETVSHIASVSKAFTATAVGELVAEGKVDWDTTPVSHYLPEFQLKDPPVPALDTAWFRNTLPRKELIKQLKHVDMPSKMSPFVNYNNIVYAVAGEAAANVAGVTFAELIKTKLLQPLGLNNAGLSMPEMAKQPNYAMPYDAASFEDAKRGIFEEGYIDDIPMADAPAGDIYMNVVDLVKWASVIMKEGELDGKQVLSQESVRETLKPHNVAQLGARRPDFSPALGYGLGWQLDSYKGHVVYYHGGGNPGYKSMLAFYPDDDLVVAVLTNVYITDLPLALPYYIADGILGLPKTADWLNDFAPNRTQQTYNSYAQARNNLPKRVEGKPHSHALIDYGGEYAHPVFGTAMITLLDNGALHLKLRTFETQLEHYHYESFKGFVHDFVNKGDIFLTFVTGSKGGVDAVEISIPMDHEPRIGNGAAHRGSLSHLRTLSTLTDETIAAFQQEFTNNLPLFQKEFLDNLPTVLEKARVDNGIPGLSVAIMHKGKLVFAQGFGKRNDVDPFTEETVSHLASVSKAFTATAIGELVAEGKMDWDTTPVNTFLPEFELKDPVLTSQLTLADLLSHRTPVPPLDFAWFRNPLPRRELIKQMKHLDLPSNKLSPFVNYNNIMYAVAGEAAANVSGMEYADLIRTKIFEPLGLKDAGLSLSEMKTRSNFAVPYDTIDLEHAQSGIFFKGYMDEIPMADAPAGDIYMNVKDLVKWGDVIMNEGELDGKQVLNRESILETLRPQNIMIRRERQSNFAPTTGYGLGWMLDSYMGHACIQHGGCNPGYRSHLAFLPDSQIVIGVLANINTAQLPCSLPYYIADGLLRVPKTEEWIGDMAVQRTRDLYDHTLMIANNNMPKKIENKPHRHELADYVGEYTHPVFGKFTITLQEDGSGLHMHMRTMKCKLEHLHFDSFKGLAHDFAIKTFLLLNFKTGSDGSVHGIETTLSYGASPEIFRKTETPKPEEDAAAITEKEE